MESDRCAKLGQASFCRHIVEFRNETWSSLDQLNSSCDTPLVSLTFEYLALVQVYTFFWGRLFRPSLK